MKKSKKIELQAAEIAGKLKALVAKDKLTDEERATMAGHCAELERLNGMARAQVLIEDAEQAEADLLFSNAPENVEHRALLARADLGNIFAAVVDHSAPTGAEAELQAAYGIAGNQVPMAALRDPGAYRAAVTPGPGTTETSERNVVQPVFAMGDAAYLSVAMPTVPVGATVFPVLSTRPTVAGPFSGSDDAAETTGAFTAVELKPERLQASFFWRRVDAFTFRGMAEALRMALRSALSEALDKEVIDRVVTDVSRTAATAADTFATVRSRQVYANVDGRHAMSEAEIRLLVGTATLAHWSGIYRSNNADDSAVDSVRRVAGGLRVSPHVAAVASNKQDVIVRKGMAMDAVAPVWSALTLISDEVTKALSGEIVLSAVAMANFRVVRASGFARVESQHA